MSRHTIWLSGQQEAERDRLGIPLAEVIRHGLAAAAGAPYVHTGRYDRVIRTLRALEAGGGWEIVLRPRQEGPAT